MNNPKILYILIGIFCVFAIIAGIYAQFIEGGSPRQPAQNDPNQGNIIVQKSQDEIKEQLSSLYTNMVNFNNYDTTGIKKINEEQDIVYTAFDINQAKEAYEINIKVPAFNISNQEASSFNVTTQDIFVNKAREVLEHTDASNKMIYSIDYAGFINGNILSVIIRSTLKEGTKPQRVMIQTYNYNLETGTKATLTDLITMKTLNKEDVNGEIKKVIQEADDAAKAIQDMGYNDIYTRDLTDTRYTVDGSTTYFLGPDANLYIIYPYGNRDYTSEMDVVLFE